MVHFDELQKQGVPDLALSDIGTHASLVRTHCDTVFTCLLSYFILRTYCFGAAGWTSFDLLCLLYT